MTTTRLLIPACIALAGCMTAARHSRELGSASDRALTVGLVQKNIKVGVSQSDVAVALGSPNIVTRDSARHETWVYDKVATEASFSQDTGSLSALLMGTGTFPSAGDSGSINGSLNGSYTKSAGAASLTQRTLTVVVKFDENSTVQSVSYQATKF